MRGNGVSTSARRILPCRLRQTCIIGAYWSVRTRARAAGGGGRLVRVERDVFIRRSREYVFAYVTDPANDALWNSTIVETVLTSDGPLGAGSTLRSTIRFVGQHTDSTFEVTDYEPDRKMCVRSTSGPIAFTGCRVVELAEGGTRVI